MKNLKYKIFRWICFLISVGCFSVFVMAAYYFFKWLIFKSIN